MNCPRCFKKAAAEAYCLFCGFIYEEDEKRREKANALPLHYMLTGKYDLGEMLGAGGFGITYLAQDTENGSIVAVKEFFPSMICGRDARGNVIPYRKADSYEASVRHFFEEAQNLFLLSNCNSVAKVKAFFRNNNTAYIVMEYVRGKTLTALAAESGGSIDYKNAKYYTLQIALALQEIHSLGVIHSDISPANVIVEPSGNIKLVDFGASRSFLEKNDDSSTVQLKPGFAPPEQYFGSKLPVGCWTDIYALGATFYRLVTGRIPPSADERSAGRELLSLSQLVPDAEERVCRCIEKALALNYKERYQNTNEFISDFSGYFDPGIPTSPDPLPDPDPNFFDGIIKRFREITSKLRNIVRNIVREDTTVAIAEVLEGINKGKQLWIAPGKQYLIGRQEDLCNLVVSDKSTISRVHLALLCAEDGKSIVVADKSKNGVSVNLGQKLNGKQISISEDCVLVLADGDAVVGISWLH